MTFRDFSSMCLVIIVMLNSLFSNLDPDRLKAPLAVSSHIDAKSRSKVDIEDCKFCIVFFIECITFHGMIST